MSQNEKCNTKIDSNTKRFLINKGVDDLLILPQAPERQQAWRLGWHIGSTIPSGVSATFEALNGQDRIGLIKFQWEDCFRTFRARFASPSTFISLMCWPSPNEPLWPPVIPMQIETPTDIGHILLDLENGVVLGSIRKTSTAIFKDLGQVYSDVLPAVEYLIRDYQMEISYPDNLNESEPREIVVFSKSKNNCDSNRKAGHTKAIAGTILAGITVMAAPISFGWSLIGMAAAGAYGGAKSAKTETNTKIVLRNQKVKKNSSKKACLCTGISKKNVFLINPPYIASENHIKLLVDYLRLIIVILASLSALKISIQGSTISTKPNGFLV